MLFSPNCVKLIAEFENIKLKAYKGVDLIWTIGYGTTKYPNGKPVMEGDTCTTEQAEAWLRLHMAKVAQAVSRVVWAKINQNQFDALVCLAYNIGTGAFAESSLLAAINKDPNDFSIAAKFTYFHKSKGRPVRGLLLRRLKEAQIYFTNNQ